MAERVQQQKAQDLQCLAVQEPFSPLTTACRGPAGELALEMLSPASDPAIENKWRFNGFSSSPGASIAEPLLAEVSMTGVSSSCPGTSQQESINSSPNAASDSRGSCDPPLTALQNCNTSLHGDTSGSTTLGALDGSESGITDQVPPVPATGLVSTLGNAWKKTSTSHWDKLANVFWGNSRRNCSQDEKQNTQHFDLAAEDWVEEEDEFFPVQ